VVPKPIQGPDPDHRPDLHTNDAPSAVSRLIDLGSSRP
jgi:hypothetical protein